MLFAAIGSIFYIGFKVQATADALEALARRIATVEDKATLVQDRLTKIEVGQNEIETQFCASDIVRNLMHANELRNTDLLWKKVFGTSYPTICNRRIKQ